VQIRAEELFTRHGKMPDCRILAEAEELELESLLTYDTKFLSRLAGASPATVVESPSSYWVRLGIPKGAKPVTIPHPTNPLSQQSWWRC
jgi:hypothetical protein